MKTSLMLHLPFITMLVVFLITCNIDQIYGQCLQDQRALLLKFKNGLTFNSSMSQKLVRWAESTDCCLWPGISCDQEGHVVALELDNETISDGVEDSSSLFDLQYLERLNLAHNYDGNLVQVPTEIYKLANLRYLNLSSSGFGQIPMELSRLTQLEFLDLSFPYYSYTMFDNLNLKTVVENLTNLRELYLDDLPISLKGSELCLILSSSLTQLRVLSMTSCNISGPLDPVLLNLRFLSVIRLDHNNLSGIVPEFLANFTELTALSLKDCQLRGKFPSKIFQVPTLHKLDLTSNHDLNGTLPEFSRKSPLREVYLRDTIFSGPLSSSIANLKNLTRLDLSGCNFHGPIPSTIGNLTNLVHLDLGFCFLDGPIPSTIGNLTNLVHLDLSINSFTSSIPLFHKAKKLTSIDLSNNNLAGPSSAHLAVLLSLPSLQFLYLQNNNVSGEVHEFANASSSVLETLDLSSNQLNGSIPRSIFELKMLSELVLSSNSFSGTISLKVIEGLPRLVRLDLSYNNLRIITHGSNLGSLHFPQLEKLSLASCGLQKFPNLRNMSSLTALDLSSNNLKEEIPSWVWRLMSLNLSSNLFESLEKSILSTTLIRIDLNSNRIKGNLPIISTSLSYFSIANNKLTGSIPSSICNLTDLRFFDMSNNAMNGKIPPCLFQEEFHNVLNLGRNKLSGAIPNTFPVNCSLSGLDLSNNILEGKVPRSLERCTDLEVLDIENNKIKDKFPCMLNKLPKLHVLVLRSNMFYGNLQCPIAKYTWPRLQILDLASNNFSGALLPQYFSKWEGMMLSRNPEPEPMYLDTSISPLHIIDYEYRLNLFFKGRKMENMKILTFFISVDFSCNNFQEEIPEILGDLKLLNHLNLSNNAFTGRIPKALGKLTKLETLDLSVNHLSGRIPNELAGLTFLSFLNLSFNQLSGRIPKGNQLQLFSADSFEGNTGLCDFPLKKLCTNTVNGLSPPSSHSEHEADEKYISFALGSSVGFGIIIWLLLHSPRYNELIERVLFKILDHHVGGRNVWRSS